MNKIFYCLKKIVFSAFLLYGYNLIAVNFNMIIPINLITLLLVSILGAPGIFGLILFRIVVL